VQRDLLGKPDGKSHLEALRVDVMIIQLSGY
jgi:hypothetical protein